MLGNGTESPIDKFIKELEGKPLEEVRKMAREEHEQLEREQKRFNQIERGEISLTIPEELKPISAEEMKEILESAEQAVLIAGMVNDWRGRAKVAEKAKKLREEKLLEAVTAHLIVKEESPGGFQPRRRPQRERRTDQFSTRPGWKEINLPCVDCGTNVGSLPFQPASPSDVRCPLCWMELQAKTLGKAKLKTRTTKTKT